MIIDSSGLKVLHIPKRYAVFLLSNNIKLDQCAYIRVLSGR